VRYANTRSVDRYGALLERGDSPIDFDEVLTPRQRLAERLILGLRLRDGVPASWIEERIALERGRLPDVLGHFIAEGLAAADGNQVRLTEAGFLLSDALFVELL
jgi:coproporphyrinogen III oxidase-like Fe-S oxidoreductase